MAATAAVTTIRGTDNRIVTRTRAMNRITHDGIMARPWAVDRMVSNWIVARAWAVQRPVVMVMIVIVSEAGTHATEYVQAHGKYKRLRHRRTALLLVLACTSCRRVLNRLVSWRRAGLSWA
jgi:hypothetical protein